MTLFTLDGLKKALTFIQENPTNIKYHQFEPRKGLISLPKDMKEEEAYHLYLIQNSDPRIIDRFGPDLTMLSVHGQELADILNDTPYIKSLCDRLRSLGYSQPSDRQIYRLLRSKMSEYANYSSTPVDRVINALSDYAEVKINPPMELPRSLTIEDKEEPKKAKKVARED